MSGKSVKGRRGIGWASIPAIAACIRSLLRQSRPWLAQIRGRRRNPPALFMTWLLCILLLAQTSALPTYLGLFLLHGDAHPVTEGCKKGTCCTPLCYVDKYGSHHCVHKPNSDSCDCGMSANDEGANPTLPSTVVTLPATANLFPTFIPVGWVFQIPHLMTTHIPATPSPPPKLLNPDCSLLLVPSGHLECGSLLPL